MANFQNLHMFLFPVVALIACLKPQFTEGRQLKVIKEHDLFTSVKMGTGLQILARKAIQKPGNTRKVDFQVSSAKKQIPPPMPPTLNHEELISSSDIHHANVLETTPGNSPGIGHHYAVQAFTSEDYQTDAFKGPGHSPGVGHSYGNANQPKP